MYKSLLEQVKTYIPKEGCRTNWSIRDNTRIIISTPCHPYCAEIDEIGDCLKLIVYKCKTHIAQQVSTTIHKPLLTSEIGIKLSQLWLSNNPEQEHIAQEITTIFNTQFL